ncbi:MAG: VanZ family protein, partial [Candidatus Omnitrophica bacterium]|nr:VanZ family protein [Candidatus Omnitrophota bacterium]
VIILSALTGLLDESLQFFVLSRDCSLGDLSNDIAAALIGQLFILLVIRPKLQFNKNRPA